jgi:hypothetical protein
VSSNSVVSGIAAAWVVFAAAALSAATPAHAAGALTVENPLQACIAVQPGLRDVEHGVALQRITLDVRKPIGACGCKSAILSYATHVVLDGGARSLLLQGRLNARDSGPRTLPLASDATLAGERPVVLSFDCVAPD